MGGKVKTGCWTREITTLSTTNPTLNRIWASSLITCQLTVWGMTGPVVRLKNFCEWYSWHLTGYGQSVWPIQFETFGRLINHRVRVLCFFTVTRRWTWKTGSDHGVSPAQLLTTWIQPTCHTRSVPAHGSGVLCPRTIYTKWLTPSTVAKVLQITPRPLPSASFLLTIPYMRLKEFLKPWRQRLTYG